MIGVIVRAIILDENNNVLVGKRVGGFGDGLWCLIGGKPDNNESKEKAIAREVYEETGLTFLNPVLWKSFISDNKVRGYHWKTYCYTGNTIGKLVINLNENSELRYVSLKEIEAMNFTPGNTEILNAFLR